LDEAFASDLPPEPVEDYDKTESPQNIAEGVNDPGAQAQVRARQHILNAAKSRIVKRREELHQKAEVTKYGPRGETRSAVLTRQVEMIPLKLITDDPDFTNLRLRVEEEDLRKLAESMRFEGLKVPITVIAVADGVSQFHVRAGFRRTTVARRLGWKNIPAVILPANTPTVEEYWTNIIENSARSQLHSYEIACAARTMRDRFHVSPLDFAQRAGYSDTYIHNLLRCLDRLPDDVLHEWQIKAPIPVKLYIQWAILEPSEASKMMLAYGGHNPQIVKDWQPAARQHGTNLLRMASTRGLKRMQQLRFAVGVSPTLSPATRALCLQLVDFCSGARDNVPDVYNPRKRPHPSKDRRRQDLPLPQPDEQPPAPEFDPDDKSDEDPGDET
jgi:ParB/RepB/Spo0J family partition protein